MKNGKFIILLLTVSLLAFMGGLFLGRYHSEGTIAVQVEKKDDFVGKIDLNNGTLEELCVIPGISEITAQRIIDYREKNGPFKRVEELCQISGISEVKLNELRDYIVVDE